MMDLSKLSDAELEQIANGGKAPPPPQKPNSNQNMLDFSKMSDAELEQIVNGGNAAPPKEKKNSRPGLAALEGFGQGLSFGYLPQLQAAAEPVLRKGYELVTGENISDGSTYTQRRDQNIKRQGRLAESNPVAYGGSQLGGTLVTGIATSGLLPGAGAAKASTKLGRIGQAAYQGSKQGIVYGAASNPGDVEGEVSPLQLPNRIENSALGGLLGYAGGAGGQAIGEGFSMVGDAFKKAAARKAFKSMGPYQRDAQIAMGKGDVEKIGQVLIDEGVVGGRPKSYEALGKKAAELVEKKGKEIGNYLEKLSEAEKALVPEGIVPNGVKIESVAGIDRKAIAESLRKELIGADNLGDISGVSKQNRIFNAAIKLFEEGDDRFLPILDAQAKKIKVGQMINWYRPKGSDIPTKEVFLRSLYNKLAQGIDDAALALEGITGKQGYKALKDTYGAAKTASKMASTRAAKESANRFLSPSDYGAGLAGAIIGGASGSSEDRMKNIILGAGLGLANKAGRQYGNQVLASGFSNLGKLASSGLATKVPGAIAPLIAASSKINPKNSSAPVELNEQEKIDILKALKKDPSKIKEIKDKKLRSELEAMLLEESRSPSSDNAVSRRMKAKGGK